MTIWARVIDGVVFETTTQDPAGRYPAEVCWTPVADGVGQHWTLTADGLFQPPSAPPPAPAAPPTDAAALARQLKAQIDAARYAAETAGITVAGIEVATDRASQSQIANAYTLLQAGLLVSPIAWHAADGSWVTVNADQVAAIAQAVARHVQACFAAGARIAAAIDAALIDSADPEAQLAALTAAAVWSLT